MGEEPPLKKLKAEDELHESPNESISGDGAAPATSPESEALDANKWFEYFDTLAYKAYYHNPHSGQTVWKLPDGAEVIGSDGLKPPEEPPAKEEEKQKVEKAPLTQDELDALKEAERMAEIARNAAIARQMAQTAQGPDGRKGQDLSSTPVVDRVLALPAPLANLPPKLKVFMRHDKPPTAAELGRPARVQASIEERQNTAYVQGQEDYNIWYGKYSSDRFGEGGKRERAPAQYHCNVFKDAGFTRADLNPHLSEYPICIHFARGCCSQGHECQYFHHVPTQAENDKLELMRDIFGRDRHAQQRDDMEGVGSFNSTSRTLFVGDYKVDRVDANFNSRVEELILAHFSVYGPIEEIRVIPNRNFAFVTFCYRAAAEFAKEAMANYRLSDTDEVLTVKWAQGNRNPANAARVASREQADARRIVMERMRQIAIDEEEYASKQRAQEGETEPSND